MTFLAKEPELRIAYYPHTDVLVLKPEGEQPQGVEGETMAKGVIAFTDLERYVVGVTIFDAARLLRPYLCPESGGSGIKGAQTGKERVP